MEHTPPPSISSDPAPPAPPRASRLPLYLALAYSVLVIYASLYPFANWRDRGVSPFAFLHAAWPRYWTVFDLVVNVLAYVPLGFLLTLTLRRIPGGRWAAAIVALLLGSLLSFCMESLQTYLPSRVASSIDLACNTLGAAVGAAIAFWRGKRIFRRIGQLQQALLAPTPHAEIGVVLLGIWLLTQLSPETLLFGTGDLRHVLELTPAVPYAAQSFFVLETGVIACNTMVVGLFARTLLADQAYPHLVLIAFFILALATRTLAAAVLITPQDALGWLTPGAEVGLLIGTLLLSLSLLLPAQLRIALAGAALMAGTALVNLTPGNPYSEAALAAWRQGNFLNFNGLTRWVASFWPFVALPYLTAVGRAS
ncbi:MAG TPA: VanZ family protein [Accumulibacter sp.]|uniref:VanZ family protein n=1 Tax=Accumulibacter sp. TaxID=2053492 RepID=UPI0025EC72F3|nr:VanZ family protein [Accumulibacter sp.]MCM8599576.1 VanZ family protein [Accumulibacter sp.]MCM8663483.1 VanZ family protein [Accumulibacter sp.]HNC50999.1 VanZ family protein [Accumulibacter sp.]